MSLPKEQSGNNFLISHRPGESPVVPLEEDRIEDNFHGLLGSRSTRASCLVHLVEDPYLHRQAGRGFGFGDIVPDRFQRSEDHPAARSRHMGEEAVLDGIVLRAVGRMVGHADLDTQPAGQFLDPLLEDIPR
jgi:hypothetical protein